jgi:tetratricopeptide (TPR) repeat protein
LRFVFDTMSTLRRLMRVDPRTVPEAGGMLAGAVGIFSWAGVSFALGARILKLAGQVVSAGGTRDLYLYYRFMLFLHHVLAGDWSGARRLDPEEIQDGLGSGRLWDVTSYLNLAGVMSLYQGDYDGAREHIDQLARIADTYQHELAASASQAMVAYLDIELGRLDAALDALEFYRDEHPEPLFQVQALSNRARIEVIRGDLEAAVRTMKRADAACAEAGRLIPYHGSVYHTARYRLDVASLEAALAAGDAGAVRAARAQARQSRKVALRVSAKAAMRRVEVVRLAARQAWCEQQPRGALRWWERAAAEAESMEMRPELARTWAELGRRLREPQAEGLEFRGRDSTACLAEAESLFAALGLGWDPERMGQAAG